MRFSELEPGMTVLFTRAEPRRWYAWASPNGLIRNPNFDGPEDWYNRLYKKFEKVPFTVENILRTNDPHRVPLVMLIGKTASGAVLRMEEQWFPDTEDAFIRPEDLKPEVVPKEVDPAYKETLRFSDLRPGMMVMFKRGDPIRWNTLTHVRSHFDDDEAAAFYEKHYKRYENVPFKVEEVSRSPEPHRIRGMVHSPTVYTKWLVGKTPNKLFGMDEYWFPDTPDAFINIGRLKGKAGDVLSTRALGMLKELPEGPESVIASYLSGIDKKSTIQQQAQLRETARSLGLKAAARRSRKTRKVRHHRRSRRSSVKASRG